MVQGMPPRVAERLAAGGKGVRGEAMSRRWREPERVPENEEGADVLAAVVVVMVVRLSARSLRACSAAGQEVTRVPLDHKDWEVKEKPWA